MLKFIIMSGNENDFDNYKIPDRREEKLYRQRHPRGRRLLNKALLQKTRDARKVKKIEEAKRKIKKIIINFENLPENKREKQRQIYVRWIKDSLKANLPILDEGDLHMDRAISSVKAGGQQRQKTRTSVRLTHLPTLISVRNEEERSFEQNRENAYESLYDKLNLHLNCWKTLSIELPQDYSIMQINRLGIEILKYFNNSFEERG